MKAQCPEPGTYHDVANATYHSWDWYVRDGGMRDEVVSASKLRAMAYPSTPAHARYLWDSAPPQERWSNLDLGSAVHTLALEPERYHDDVCVVDRPARRSAAGKELYDTLVEENKSRTLISPEQAELVHAMAHALRSNDAISDLLASRGETEVSTVFDHGGERVRCRLDKVCRNWHGHDVVLDIKTTGKSGDARPEYFASKMANYDYAMQAGIYTRAAQEMIESFEPVAFLFAVVEVPPPHATSLLRLKSEDLWLGYGEFLSTLNQYSECKASGVWPAYTDEVLDVELPAWKRQQLRRKAAAFEREMDVADLEHAADQLLAQELAKENETKER